MRQARPQSTALASDTASTVTMPGGFDGPPAVPVALKPVPPLPTEPAPEQKPMTPEPTLSNESMNEKDGKTLRPKSTILNSVRDLGRKFTRSETGTSGPLISGGQPGFGPPQHTPSSSGHVTPLTNISERHAFVYANWQGLTRLRCSQTKILRTLFRRVDPRRRDYFAIANRCKL